MPPPAPSSQALLQHVLESDAFTILGNYVNEITLQVSRVYL